MVQPFRHAIANYERKALLWKLLCKIFNFKFLCWGEFCEKVVKHWIDVYASNSSIQVFIKYHSFRRHVIMNKISLRKPLFLFKFLKIILTSYYCFTCSKKWFSEVFFNLWSIVKESICLHNITAFCHRLDLFIDSCRHTHYLTIGVQAAFRWNMWQAWF